MLSLCYRSSHLFSCQESHDTCFSSTTLPPLTLHSWSPLIGCASGQWSSAICAGTQPSHISLTISSRIILHYIIWYWSVIGAEMRVSAAVCFISALVFTVHADVYFKEQFLDGGKCLFSGRAWHQTHSLFPWDGVCLEIMSFYEVFSWFTFISVL